MLKFRHALAFAVTVSAGALILTGAAQASGQPDGFGLVVSGRYLDGEAQLRRQAFDESGDVRDRGAAHAWLQASPMLYGYVRREDVARVSEDQRALTAGDRDQLGAVELQDAIGAIVKRARRTSIVILNEAHHSPRDRAFALEVARALRPLGYSVLAAETFANRSDGTAMAALASDCIPRRSTGTYTADPVFADFVRQAVALGYRPVAYEQTAEQSTPDIDIPVREQAQTDNLMTAVFKSTPEAKVLIFVGFSHVAEAPIGRTPGTSIEWMAARLKKMTGIDPLTIDQTTISETAMHQGGRDAFDIVRPKVGRRSVVAVRDSRPLTVGPYAGAVDLQIVHPPLRLANGRPDWLARMGRHPMAVPQIYLPTTGRVLVQASLTTEPDDAVPIDQVVVEAGRPVPKFMLPRGKFRFAVQRAP